jgi:Spy/CpxP family protein refolding chaperone
MGITVKDAGPHDSSRKGVVVSDVIKGGPAEAAGIGESDVIVGLNGHEVYGVADFVTEIQHLGVGEPVVVEVDRNGAVKSIDVVLTRRPAGLFTRRGAYAAPLGRSYAREAPDACDGHDPHMGDFGMPGAAKYDKMYFVRMSRMLGLDSKQRRRSDELESAYLKRSIALGSEIRIAGLELEELAYSDKTDLRKVRSKIDEIASKEAELRFMRFESLDEFRKILTPKQRERMDKLTFMDAAGYDHGYGYMPGSMGYEVYGGSGGCSKSWRDRDYYLDGPVIEEPAR